MITRAMSNGVHQDSRLTGMFPELFRVSLNPESLLNIFSMSNVTDHFRVTIDSSVDNAIIVYVDTKRVLRFEKI